MRWLAAATMAARPSVVFSPESSDGRSQFASASSSLSETSPGDPARRKRQNDEVPLDPSLRIPRDHLAISGKLDRLDFEAGFFPHLADHRLFECLPEFDAAARQRIEAVRGRLSPAHNEHATGTENGGADCEVGLRRVTSR